jgi:hypothetical protein
MIKQFALDVMVGDILPQKQESEEQEVERTIITMFRNTHCSLYPIRQMMELDLMMKGYRSPKLKEYDFPYVMSFEELQHFKDIFLDISRRYNISDLHLSPTDLLTVKFVITRNIFTPVDFGVKKTNDVFNFLKDRDFSGKQMPFILRNLKMNHIMPLFKPLFVYNMMKDLKENDVIPAYVNSIVVISTEYDKSESIQLFWRMLINRMNVDTAKIIANCIFHLWDNSKTYQKKHFVYTHLIESIFSRFGHLDLEATTIHQRLQWWNCPGPYQFKLKVSEQFEPLQEYH